MTKQIEAMKLALEALETELSVDWTNNDEFNASAEKMYEAITAIKEALADHAMQEVQRLGQEIEQEPGTLHIDRLNQWLDASLKAKAAQRTWVGLTEQEHTDIAVECGCMSADWVFYGAAVERKVKEKNT